LRAALESWRFSLFTRFLTFVSNELLDCGHGLLRNSPLADLSFHSLLLYRFYRITVNLCWSSSETYRFPDFSHPETCFAKYIDAIKYPHFSF
jgi:hypothetical protein